MTAVRLRFLRMVPLCALSMSIGWGIRGNFGHAYGAMLAGTLPALAAVLMAGRPDWWRRVAYFGALGGLGWSFGGTISYMQVIAYTHSGHFPSQVYGFACLFVIGFTWAVLGGMGTALPACLDRDRLTGLFLPIGAVFLAWFGQDLVVPFIVRLEGGDRRHESILYWYDTNWLAALTALGAVLLLAAIRRRLDRGSRFILHLAVGWWMAFLGVVFLVDVAGIEFRMTPPRGDNWAGALGMTGGALLYCWRHGLRPVAWAGLVCGIVGGFGFLAATFLKIMEVKYVPLVLSHAFGDGAWQTNWHSILEQTYGLFNGIGVALALASLAHRCPVPAEEERLPAWTEVAAVAFILVGVTYVNLVKNVPNWVQLHAIPMQWYGVPSRVWFNGGYAILALAILLLLTRHMRGRLAVVPESALGKAQLLFLVFLWWVVVGNLMRAIPPFADQRLITEGVIYVNAIACSLLALLGPGVPEAARLDGSPVSGRSLSTLVGVGLLVMAVAVAGASFGVRATYGDTFVGQAGPRPQPRFGPDAHTSKPEKGKAHP